MPATHDNGLVPQDSPWRTGSEWYRNVETAPVAEHSSEMLQALVRWGTTGVFQIDFSFVVLDGTGGANVNFPQGEETDNVPVPVPAKGYIEGGHAYDACPVDSEDCHMLVLVPGAKRLYETYQTRRNGSTWEGAVTMWQLDKLYPRSNRGQGCTSADAAGMAITPGLIGYREAKSGTLAHALRLVIRNDYIRGKAGDKNVPNVAYPASHGSTAGAAATGLPYGARLRLKPSVKEGDPRFKSAGAKTILRALHRYGMIVADGGNIPLMAESDRVYKDSDPKETWEGTLGPRDLDGILPSDFEVIAIPKDRPGGPVGGFYQSRAEYEADLKRPLGCTSIVQP